MLIKGDKREQINSLQFYLDRDLTVAEAEKIVCLMASAKITAVEAMNGEAKVAYKVTYKTVYKSSSGIGCAEESFDQSTVLKSAAITAKSYLDLGISVISNEFVGTANLKVRTALEIKGYTIVSKSFATPDPIEGIFTKTTPVVVECIEPVRESEIIASSDFETKEVIEKILCYDTQIMVKSVSTATEIMSIRGECYTYLIYIAGGGLNSKCIVTPFSAELMSGEMKEGSEAFCSAEANSTNITLSAGENTSLVKVEVVAAVRGFSVRREKADVLCDAYSKNKELKIETGDAVIESSVCLTGSTEKISGSVRMKEDGARIRSVLCVCAPSAGAINVGNVAGLTAEGIVTVTVIYLDEEENVSSVLAELPYHFTLSRDFPCQQSLYGKAMVAGINARARHNDEIEITGDLCIEVYGADEKNIVFVKSMEELGEHQINDCAISLYIVRKGETMWDVAKALMTDEETLMNLNGDIALPLKGGEKVLLYREL